jgi:hypothetical protein
VLIVLVVENNNVVEAVVGKILVMVVIVLVVETVVTGEVAVTVTVVFAVMTDVRVEKTSTSPAQSTSVGYGAFAVNRFYFTQLLAAVILSLLFTSGCLDRLKYWNLETYNTRTTINS